MTKTNNKFMVSIYIIATILLTATLAASIVFAILSTTKQSTTQISFADNIVLSSSGISNNTWTNDASGVVVDPVTFAAQTVTATKGPSEGVSVYVRMFAVVWSNSSVALADFAEGADATVVSSENYTTKEAAYITQFETDSITNYKTICVTVTFTEVDQVKAMIAAYVPFADSAFENNGEDLMGKYVNGSVVISALNGPTGGNAPTTAEWNAAQTSYTFSTSTGMSTE